MDSSGNHSDSASSSKPLVSFTCPPFSRFPRLDVKEYISATAARNLDIGDKEGAEFDSLSSDKRNPTNRILRIYLNFKSGGDSQRFYEIAQCITRYCQEIHEICKTFKPEDAIPKDEDPEKKNP